MAAVGAFVLLSACGGAPLPAPAPATPGVAASARAAPLAGDAEPAERIVASRSPLFPAAVQPLPLAQRLCEVVLGLPAQRRAECCGSAASSGLLGECVRTLSSALADGTVSIEKRKLDACAADIDASTAGCDWVGPLAFRIPASCRELVRGRLDAGAACRSSLECRDGLYCRGLGPSAPGRCSPPAAPGAPCLAPVETMGLYSGQSTERLHPFCTGYCLAGRCQAFAAVGAPCRSDVQCGPGAHCAGGRCAAGEHPPPGASCAGTTCGPGAACIDGRCAPWKAAGEPCRGAFECRGGCVKADGAEVGRCGMQCGK